MIPIRDINPTTHRPVVTWGIIGLNVAAWGLLQGFGFDERAMANSLCELALIPGDLMGSAPRGALVPLTQNLACELTDTHPLLTLFTHMFLHGGWFHIIANMWFLWIFGDNVEDVMGPRRFAAFYVLCGLAAAMAQLMANSTALVPMVGASGAIGGVMGAYARLFPHARIVTLVPLGFYLARLELPAIAMLGYWFFLQLASGVPALSSTGGGVAFWAHIGGFLAGLILAIPMSKPASPYAA